MSLTKPAALFSVLALLSKVQAHGHVTGVVAGGEWYSGYIPSFVFQKPPPVVAGWTTNDVLDNGFVSDYNSPDIICHKGASPGGAYIQVAAGSSVELQWTDWPESHHGPVMDFLAACGDDCATVDKTQLLFNKIDEAGLIEYIDSPGRWASDELIANNNSWTVTIPSNIAPGKYVLRHDTIALHSAFDVGGSQAYPQCFNLEITGSGSNTLSTGTLGTDLYNDEDPGIHLSIYYPKLTSYVIPGPPLIDGFSDTQPAPSSSITSQASTSASTTKAWGIDITTSVTAPTQVVSNSAIASSSTTGQPSKPETSAPSEPATSQAPPPSPPANTDRPEGGNGGNGGNPNNGGNPGPGAGQPTSPVSFTSTVTGRIGKPTKFTCYIDED
ncbi:murein transglycosylase [Exophiala aquamarina CBS 119918]|uniref:Murein transglycosylase n=1 Tax=Exophiala aquamarina CBS 119918 TaxID=1182545 RepID=A0A072NUP8_9EURO|nr:murein transglycosylase [Exophiala aquamarina CBS 119918]KEF51604.1 murein transglycosylase [Exophiala aquamarina CBS 119918]